MRAWLQRIFAFMLLTPLLLVGSGVLAQTPAKKYGYEDTQATANLPTSIAGQKTAAGVVGAIIQVVLGFVAFIFFFLVLYSGVIWMTAQGNSDKVEQAKGTIEAAIIGLVLIMAAYAITNFIFEKLT